MEKNKKKIVIVGGGKGDRGTIADAVPRPSGTYGIS